MSVFMQVYFILMENQTQPLLTGFDELKFYRRLRFLGYF